MILALGHPFCMHALLACCGAEMPTSADSFRQLARFHYTSAVAGLRDILNDAHLVRRWVVAMLTIMMLCIYEVSRTDYLHPLNGSPARIHV
jgi:NADH:ubiquinone oxidoreductase subunit B-like Fe-S oxidoreductase